MDFNTLTTTLDSNFQRNVTQATNYPTGISYLNTANYDITINNTLTNCKQICLQNTTQGIKVHINHHNRHKITTIGLDDITSLTIT